VALNIRNEEANRLAAEVATLTGETKTEAVILALKERLQRLRRERNGEADQQARRLDRLDRIALHCAALPLLDQRNADEICGYDAMGFPS
jgi:antitoxin VapB